MFVVLLIPAILIITCVVAAELFPYVARHPAGLAKAEQDILGIGPESGQTGGGVYDRPTALGG